MASKGRKTCLLLNFFVIFVTLSLVFVSVVNCKKKKNVNADEAWKKKDITDYSDADLERLYEQWEVKLIFGLLPVGFSIDLCGCCCCCRADRAVGDVCTL